VVELRSCLDGLERVDVPEALGETNVLSEARSALEALGYPGADASRALQAAKAAGTDADDVAALVRGALRVLGGARVGA
jgi:Holliday junction resolvasome RuvABC DNA-binding subunit